VIVDLTDEMDELAIYTPKMIEDRVEVKNGDLLFLHTGWEKHAQFGSEADEEKYIHRHPGAHPDMVPWLLEKGIHIWGVDCISTDHPMNLPIGRFLGKGMHGHCDRVRKQCEDKFGGPEGVAKLFPDSAYQLTHNALFPKHCMHIENLGGDITAPECRTNGSSSGASRGSSRAARLRSAARWRLRESGNRNACRSSTGPRRRSGG
jgi:kynurenine formamidase